MNMKDFWVGRILLVTCSISKLNILAFFQNKHLHFQNILQNLKTFSKDQHLCIHSYKQESLHRLPKQWPLHKILSKNHTKHNFKTKMFWKVWYGGRTDLRFCVCVRKCFRLARVATDFLFYPKERSKSTGKTFEMFSWVRGVDYEKGRC